MIQDTLLDTVMIDAEQLLLSLCKRPDELHDALMTLSKHRIVTLIKHASIVRKEKYEPKHLPLYGDLPRGFNIEQLRLFFKHVHSRDAYRRFLIMAMYGLRIGEVCSGLEIMSAQGMLRITNFKKNRKDSLPIHSGTINILEMIISKPTRIDNLRKLFNSAIRRAGLEYIYAHDRKGQKLRLLTPHSLRYFGIGLLYDYLGYDAIRTSRFSRHEFKSKYGALPTYITYPMDRLKNDLEEAWKSYADLVTHATI